MRFRALERHCLNLARYTSDSLNLGCRKKNIMINSPGLKVIKLFLCSTQLSMEFELLIKTKMLKNKDFPSLSLCHSTM